MRPKHSIIITHDGYQDVEVIYPYYRLQECGAVTLVSNKVEALGINGTRLIADLTLTGNYIDLVQQCDLLVLPGGVKAMEKLRQDTALLGAVRRRMESRGLVASICSGAQILISAEVIAGRRVSAYYAMTVDIKNAGAVFDDSPCVIDDNLISSPHYKFMPEWMAGVVRELTNGV